MPAKGGGYGEALHGFAALGHSHFRPCPVKQVPEAFSYTLPFMPKRPDNFFKNQYV